MAHRTRRGGDRCRAGSGRAGADRSARADETRRGKPRWAFCVAGHRWVPDAWDTGFVDLAGAQGLLGQVEGRTSACVVDWLQARTPQFREAIRYVAIDPAAVYVKAIAAVLPDGTRLLPNATVVVDHLHLVKLANDAVTAVRRRVIWEQKGRRGRKVDPAWANRRRLLTGRERLSPKGFTTVWNSLMDSEPTGQVLTAWIGKEELRALFALARSDASRDQIAARLYRFYAWCAASDLPELHTLSPRPWRPGGRPSRPSSRPGSRTPAPRASTGW